MPKKNAAYYVFSTLTASQVYTRTEQGGADLPRTVAEVFIAGGSNIPDKYMRTPIGVMTPVTDEEMGILQENDVFNLHKANGFITVEEAPADAEKVAADMVTRDDSAPLVDEDFDEDNKPKTNAPKASSRKA